MNRLLPFLLVLLAVHQVCLAAGTVPKRDTVPSKSSITSNTSRPTPTMGPPADGPHCELVGQLVDIVKADAFHCGFNDISFPNSAKYKSQKLLCREYIGGVIVKVYSDKNETFESCITP